MRTGFFFLLFICGSVAGQDLNGLWAGSMFNDSTQANIRYEIAISEEKGKFTAYSLTTFIVDGQEYRGLKSVKVSRYQGRFTFEDQELLSHNYPVAPPKGVRQLTSVALTTEGSVPVLSGKFITTRTREYGRQVGGTVRLEKQNDLKPSAILPALADKGLSNKLAFLRPFTDEPVAVKPVPPPAAKTPEPVMVRKKSEEELLKESLAKRKVETVQTIEFSADSLLLTLYDNGFVDGDSVSLILNGRVLKQHQLLSTQPVNHTLQTPRGTADSLMLVMFAENLGSIAPNSGLLVIIDGDQRHEITFSGDLQKNAAVVLKRKKR